MFGSGFNQLLLTFPLAVGFNEILLAVGIFVLFFGGRKIPGLARGLGSGIRNFQRGLKGEPKQETAELRAQETAELRELRAQEAPPEG